MSAPVPVARSRRARLGRARPSATTLALAAAFLVTVLMFVVLPLGTQARILAGHIVLIVLPATAAVCLSWAAARAPRAQRVSWLPLALACALPAAGQLVLAVRTVGLGLPERFPSTSFFLFVGFHPLVVAGLVVALRPRRTRGLALEALLDALLILLTLGLALIRLVIVPLRAASPWLDPFLWILFTQLLFSVASLVCAGLLLVWREPALPPRSVVALLAAMAVNAVTNLLIVANFDPDPYHPGHAFSLFWVAGWLAMAAAGIEAAHPSSGRAPYRWRHRVPGLFRQGSVPAVLVVLGAVAMGLMGPARQMPETRLVLLLLTAALTVRWFVALRATERGGEHQRALAHTRALAELSNALSTAGELRHALDLVASWAQRLLRARGAAVEIADGEGSAVVMAAVGSLALVRGRTRPESSSFLPWISGGGGARERVVDNAADLPAAAGLAIPPGVALAAAPLRFGAGASGTLVLTLDASTLDATERELLGALGDQAAIAVENRRLAEEGRKARERRFQSEKLAMVGQLAGAVAHEINNPLAAINSAAELLLDHPPEDAENLRLLTLVRAEARRAGVIVRSLLELVRPEAVCMELLDPVEVIEDTLRLRAYAHGLSNITVVRDVGRVPRVRADRSRLRQAFLNLLVNAEQAVVNQPIRRLQVQTRTVGDHVEVTVADNGPGIPADKLEKVFEPFFTTRPVGEGTGLGLAVTYGIVRDLGGTIRASNGPLGGAVFTIRLPADPAADEAEPTPEAPPAIDVRAGGSVLLVDDESAVREVTARALRRAGFTVEIAYSGESALELLRGRTFDAVLTDVNMPGIGGAGLYCRLQELGIPLLDRFLFMSGDTVAEATRRFVRDTGQPCLTKPFELQELVAAVARLTHPRA